jgi:hypothetical protein
MMQKRPIDQGWAWPRSPEPKDFVCFFTHQVALVAIGSMTGRHPPLWCFGCLGRRRMRVRPQLVEWYDQVALCFQKLL